VIDAHGDVDRLACAVEDFLIHQALLCGVVLKQEVYSASNPNK
jgi:hypothetical protein